MKVLLCVRQDYYRKYAGDSMQVLNIYKYLKDKNVQVDINNGCLHDYSDYDIIHIFNLNYLGDAYKYYKIAHKNKKNIIVTPMYWDLSKYYSYKDNMEGLKLWERCSLYRKEILKGSTLICCGSNIEKENILSKVSINTPFKVIYNGIEVEDESIPLYNFKERHKLDSYILSVGRINDMKNQLLLAKVCNKLNLPLVLIGSIDDKAYFKECMKYKNVMYIGFMDSYNIYNAYRFAKLHVLPSFMEIPGISSLEAAAAGCTIVTTQEGSAKEYFGDEVLYCNPYEEDSFIKSIEEGLRKQKNEKVKNHVLKNYNNEKYCNEIVNIYKQLI